MPDSAPLGPPRLKKLLRSGRQLLGMWLMSRDPYIVETAAYVGYDVLLIDAEHTSLAMRDIEMMLIAIQGSPAIPIVRMPWNDQVAIKQVLDMGLEGMVVPMIMSAEDARRLVAYSSYPPAGVRGIGPRRAQYLAGGAWEYQRIANEEIVCVIPQIEHIDAVKRIDEICCVPGLSGLFLGPSDLSLSMLLPGEYAHPDFIAARDAIWEASQRYHLPLAVATTGPEDAEMWLRRGARIVFLGSEVGHMVAGAKSALERLRKARGGQTGSAG